MGAYLSQPVTEKEVEKGEDERFKYGTCGMQGWRTEMEDAHANVLDLDAPTHTSFFAIFDGHGGQEVAKFCAKFMAQELQQQGSFKKGDMGDALTHAYLRMDELLSAQEARGILEGFAGKPARDRNQMDIDEDQLPAVLKFAIKAARERAAKGEGSLEDDGIAETLGLVGDGSSDEPEVAGTLAEAMSQDGEDSSDPGSSPPEHEGVQRASTSGEGAAEGDSEEASEGSPEAGPAQEWSGPSAGCTAVSAIVRGDTLTVANAGDSRCVLCRKGKAVAMSEDHKPNNPEEHERITKAGGFVAEGRVNGSLNLSRAVGDHEYKMSKQLGPEAQIVTVVPEIRSIKLQAGDEFLLLACDGIWDVMTNQEAITMVREKLSNGDEPDAICKAMCDHCMAPDTQGDGKGCDNMSIMVVLLKDFSKA